MILPPPARRSLADEVLERLRESILRGQFEPGESLQATRLAESMAISPGPVRDALRRLEQPDTGGGRALSPRFR
jgi:DNA-binding GntR family transcriptional regulator